MESIKTCSRLDIKSKEFLDWIEDNTLSGPISNIETAGYNNFMQIPLFYGMIESYFKENKGINTFISCGGFYQCYRVRYNEVGYVIGRRNDTCCEYRIARYKYNEDLVDLEDVQTFIKENIKIKKKERK